MLAAHLTKLYWKTYWSEIAKHGRLQDEKMTKFTAGAMEMAEFHW